MGILVITVDLQCCHCKKKIKNVLECLQEDYCIEKIENEDKDNKLIVRGKFEAEKLRKKIWSNACKAVKEIIIVDVWPPPKPSKAEPPKPKPKPTPPPPTPTPTYKFVPYPYPVPYPMQCQGWLWNYPPQQCHCCPAQAPKPPPSPESKPCECWQSHHHGQGGCGCSSKSAPLLPCHCGCSKPFNCWPPQHLFFPPP